VPGLSEVEGKPRVGISSCLLGQTVRYDGGHKRAPSLVDKLDPLVEWVPVCPEIEIGLGVPRPPIDLYARGGGVRLVMPATGRDLTDDMRAYARAKVARLAALDLSGYVLKAKSPSCGLGTARVLDDEDEVVHRGGTGLFAEALKARLPELPVEEETALQTPEAIDSFFERILRYRSGRRT
jgi:uncharacterized protein YbbK (DUF523 family)